MSSYPWRQPADPEPAWQRCMAAGEKSEQHRRFAEAEEQYRDALQIAERFGEEDLRLARTLTALGALTSRHGSHSGEGDSAEALLQRALATRERVLGPDHPEVARVLVPLASHLRRPGPQADPTDAALAAALLERAIAIETEDAEVDRDLLAETSNGVANLSGFLSRQGLAAAAEALHHRLIALHEKQHGPACGGVAMARGNLACFYEGQGRLAAAEAQLRQVLEYCRNDPNPGSRHQVAFTLQRLGLLSQNQGRWPEAAALLREALAASESLPDSGAPGSASFIRTALAEVCLGLGEYEEAERLIHQVRALEENAAAPPLPHGWARKTQVDLLKTTGRYREAWQLEHRALPHPPGSPDRIEALRRRVPLPRPDPDQQPAFVWITALSVGYVTDRSAGVRWQTSDDAPCTFRQRQSHAGGYRSGGSTGPPARDHASSMRVALPADPVEIEVFAPSTVGVDRIAATLIPARAPEGCRQPCLRMESQFQDLGHPDLAEIAVRFINEGAGAAQRVRIEHLVPADGWQLLAQSMGGEPLLLPVNLGRISPGSTGLLIVRLRRRYGSAAAALMVSGSYQDAGGTQQRF